MLKWQGLVVLLSVLILTDAATIKRTCSIDTVRAFAAMCGVVKKRAARSVPYWPQEESQPGNGRWRLQIWDAQKHLLKARPGHHDQSTGGHESKPVPRLVEHVMDMDKRGTLPLFKMVDLCCKTGTCSIEQLATVCLRA